MISIPLDSEIWHLVLCPCICSRVCQFIVYGNLNRIWILLLCENYINLNYVELVHSAFQIYCILLLLFILLILSLILKVQLKILIYLLKNNCNLQWNFPHISVGKEYACNVEDSGLIPGSGRPLEKEMATHSSILAWRIPWTEYPGRLRSMWSQELDTTQQLNHQSPHSGTICNFVLDSPRLL